MKVRLRTTSAVWYNVNGVWENMVKDMKQIVNYCSQNGFIYQGSEIYGGLANSWDYGPLGRELKENLKNKSLGYY